MEINEEKEKLKKQIVEILKTCYDPEIPVDIYELGLIYDVDIDDENNAYIKMTLTSPACPVAGSLPIEVESKVKSMNELSDVKVDVVWDPPWDQGMMSEAAKVELGFF
jgi:FeS assembly SUF system protein